MNRYDYHKPGTIEEAVGLMAALEGAKYIAGGTDVMVLIRQKKLKPKNLISIRNIKGLAYIDTANGLKFGAATTHSDIDSHDVIKRKYSALTDATSNLRLTSDTKCGNRSRQYLQCSPFCRYCVSSPCPGCRGLNYRAEGRQKYCH